MWWSHSNYQVFSVESNSAESTSRLLATYTNSSPSRLIHLVLLQLKFGKTACQKVEEKLVKTLRVLRLDPVSSFWRADGCETLEPRLRSCSHRIG